MVFLNHALLGVAANIAIKNFTTTSSISPVILPAPGREVDMELRVTAPLHGNNLPIVIFSHGEGPTNWIGSIAGYGPLYEYWAGQGFVVIQPTHLSSATLGLKAPAGQEYFWESRAEDITWILDHIDDLETAVPSLKGRLDTHNVAVAGHSMGAWTASMVLGAKNISPLNSTVVNRRDKRIKAGVILSGTGNGGEDLSDQGRQSVPFYGPDFSSMTPPALVVYGEQDLSPYLTVRGADWHGDPYTLAKGPKDLFVVKGGQHNLGGIAGWDTPEGTDADSPQRLGSVQRATSAYLRSVFYRDDSWEQARKVLIANPNLGAVEQKH